MNGNNRLLFSPVNVPTGSDPEMRLWFQKKEGGNENNVAGRSMRLAGMDPFLDINSDAFARVSLC